DNIVKKYPTNLAISTASTSYTYLQLNKRVNKLANMLSSRGVGVGDFVSILMERSIETVISLLGIMKVGAVYVPLDPEHPVDRNLYIISDTNSKFIITKHKFIKKAQSM